MPVRERCLTVVLVAMGVAAAQNSAIPDLDRAQAILDEILTHSVNESNYLLDVREKDLFDAGVHLTKQDPAHFHGVLTKQLPKSKELSRFGFASQKASSMLAKHFRLTRQQVVYDLERVDVASSRVLPPCPATPRSARQSPDLDVDGDLCSGLSLLYRNPDSSCNNLKNPTWGASFQPFLRFLPPVYGDTVGEDFRLPVNRRPNNLELPSPRTISGKVHKDVKAEAPQFSILVMQWGQFLDHDITFTPMTRGFNGSMVKCCSSTGQPLPEDLMHPECRPIHIPDDDPFFAPLNVRCMNFVRSSPAPRRGCSLGTREQINQVTSYIDASNVYGSSEQEVSHLRLFQAGKLRFKDLHIRKPLLPALENEVQREECKISTANLHCFAAGDSRVNEQPGLTAMHTIWMREHNRLADELQQINPHWDDERLFHESRKIVGAMHQHITYNEWLPIILGPRVLSTFELTISPRGYYHGYNASVNPTVANEVASAAFRFGHSLVNSSIGRCNKEFRDIGFEIDLFKEMNNPANLHNFGSVDRIMLGLSTKNMRLRDEFITDMLTNHLFQTTSTDFGMDLVSLNIQRGRDHGLPPYNRWRETCGLTTFTSFSQMGAVMDSRTALRLSEVYDDVDDIDLFTGAMAERSVAGGVLGPTFACILGQQFHNLRKGDRFWYENGPDANPGAFSPEQLQEIRKSSLSRVICDNLDDIDVLQPYAFLMIDRLANQRTSCRSAAIPRVNLKRWKEEEGRTKPIFLSAVHPAGEKPTLKPLFGDWYNFGNHPKLSKPGVSPVSNEDEDQDVDLIQMRIPDNRDPSTFTKELPKPLSGDSYYRFYDDEAGGQPAMPVAQADREDRSFDPDADAAETRRLHQLFDALRKEPL